MGKLIDRLLRRKPRPAEPPAFQMAPGAPAWLVEALTKNGLIRPTAEVVVQHHPGIMPPGAAAEEQMTWASWAGAMAGELAQPGWSPCRFGARAWFTDQEDKVNFMFGVARGPFGVYMRPHPVCDHDDPEEEQVELQLASLSHLPSGIGLGVFCDRPTACAAADALLASNIDVPWERLTDAASDSVWREVHAKTLTAWQFNGFGVEPHRHAHAHPGGPMMVIWSRGEAALVDGKPEKLS